MQLEVFMPFYGDVELFKVAVISVRDQTDPDWHLTIIDDRYPSELPQTFVESLNDARITYHRNTENLGISANFQKCIDLATADYVTIMGCDDALRPNYVARIKEIIALGTYPAYIQPGVEVIDGHGETYLPLGDKVKRKLRNEFGPPIQVGGENLASSLMKGCWTYFPSIAWKTSILKNFNFRPEFRIVLDLAMQLDIIAGGGEVFVDNEVSFAYRRHRASESMKSASDGSRFIEESALFSEFAVRAHALGWAKAARAARLHLTSRLNAIFEIPQTLVSGHPTGFFRLIKHAFWV